jgi:hypothetical protein
VNEQLSQSPVVTEDLVLAKCRYFVDVGLWPRRSRLDPVGWLENFSEAERNYAVHLLNAFMFYSEDLTQQIFVGAFTNLSKSVAVPGNSTQQAMATWRQFLSKLLIVRVTGEMPSDADSGYLFARMARDRVGIAESQIVSPSQALSKLLNEPTTPIVFVDDFVGSGLQFVTLYQRKYKIGSIETSFVDIVAQHPMRATLFYSPLFCTTKGAKLIRDSCPNLVLSPAHELSARYNALAADSVIWPEKLRPSGQNFIETASQRARIPDNGGGVGDWRGFHKLGLTIGFSHGTPDATLPLFYWNQNSWKPLVRK